MIKYTRTTADKLDTVPLIDGQVITVLDGDNYIQYYDFYDSNSNTVIRRTAKSSGSGHTILNGSGTSMTQRSNLQFSGGLTTSDDSTNGKTVVSVDVTNQITQSETKPVSSGAVYTAIGNIETLLASI